MKKFLIAALVTGALSFGIYQFHPGFAYAASGNDAAEQQGQRQRPAPPKVYPAAQVDAGGTAFQQNCAFCHGRDAQGGESGPDLTRSQLVTQDNDGDKIGDVVKNGRNGRMPPFPSLGGPEILNLAAFIHTQQNKALEAARKGQRKGVDVADLQTGNLEAGKAYFNGAGGCAKCHSATGDLAGIAGKYQGLQLEMRMLMPRDVKPKVAVTLPSGQKVDGVVEYQDEWVLGVLTADGTYKSWQKARIKYEIDPASEAHANLLPKYTDDDIHNLMAYIQTLK